MNYQKGFIVPLLLILAAILLLGGGAYMFQSTQTNQPGAVTPTTQTISTAQTTGPTGILLPTGDCKVAQLASNTEWLIDCGVKGDSDARGTLGEILKQQGWIECDFGLGTATWWKGETLTTIIQNDGSRTPFRITQQSGRTSCQY